MMTKPIAGYRILFISPIFFDYEQDIKEALESCGARVDWLPDRPYVSPLLRAVTTYMPKLTQRHTDQIYRDRIQNFEVGQYDIVFVVNGQTLSEKVLTGLKIDNPNAQFILYLWDSIANRPNALAMSRHFDRILSFDRLDAVRYGWLHRPLFYGPRIQKNLKNSPVYLDISFVGTIHSDRYRVINGIRSSLGPGVKSFWFLYMQAPWVFYAHRLTNTSMRGSKYDEFSFKPLSKAQLGEIFQSSRCVVDVEHHGQIGLTMRTIETLGAGKKLITTNSDIINYDFYNPENICLVDKYEPEISLDFIYSNCAQLSDAILYKYSLLGWLDDIFG